MKRKMANDPPHCLSLIPLDSFQPGQKLVFRFTPSPGHRGWSFGKFVKIERGLVVIKYLQPWQPDWMDKHRMARLFPEGTARVRPTSVGVYGQGPGDQWPQYYWFTSSAFPPK